MAASWVTADLINGKNRQISELKALGNWAVWLEKSLETGGKRHLCGINLSLSQTERKWIDFSSSFVEIGAQVNEYGGGSWAGYWDKTEQNFVFVYADSKRGGVWASFFSPKNWAQNLEIQLVESSAESENFYADFSFDSEKKGCFAVKEKRFENGTEAQEIVYISLKNLDEICEKTLLSGRDFFASPCCSADGNYLAFISWKEGEMPWTATALKCLSLKNPEETPFLIAGDNGQESLMEPHWDKKSPILSALSDKMGMWNPVLFTLSEEKGVLEAKREDFSPAPEEIGIPAWQFSQKSLLPLGEKIFLGRSLSQGVGKLWFFEEKTGWQVLEGIFPVFRPERLENGIFICLNAPADAPLSLVAFSLSAGKKIKQLEIFRYSWELPQNLSPSEISIPKQLEFLPSQGIFPLRALYYPATSQKLLKEGKTPLIVKVHGGPTGSAQGALDLRIQYWTSQGFSVLEVDYRGSAGYGRAYREALNGKWGVLDVQDCCEAAKCLLEIAPIDPQRCVIRGSSAGGLTALAALVQENSPFKATCCLYGVTDLSALAGEGPRFEAYYVESLVGKYPEEKAVYTERSPISWLERLTAPILFLHGGRDRVVPAEQAKKLAEKLPCASFHLYPEEGHGFQQAEIVLDALTRERRFYQAVFAAEEAEI
ncbi:S9 family peptidase [Acetobacteraceae bacterium]|nr:S9 family peptidase [Acetobacteraceae bacterium]